MLLFFGGLGAFAISYTANPVSFKVLVNGNEFVSDPPPLEVDGRTYLPLRAIGEALGVPVNWNEELKQAEVGNGSPVAQVGQYSRQNPAPINTVQTINIDNYSEKYSVAVRVMETIRGEDEIYKRMKKMVTNETADDGYDLMVVKLAVSLLTVDGDKAVEIDSYNFKPYTSNNEETKTAYLHMEGENGFNWLRNKMFVGGNTEGYIVIQVRKTDDKPKLVYGMNYDGSGGIWFSLY